MQYVIELLSSYDISIAYYFCPHLPKEIERNPCQCRKPMPGMLLQAAYELHIDLRSSIMIGDRLSDIQAAAAAGVPRRFLVGESSYSVQDARNIVTSRFDSLMDCVNKIQL
jgi:D-glycero-D-manno-heptose 1,7-bisphosphate phosphatase